MKQVIQTPPPQARPVPKPDQHSGGHMLDEADIGSGGKTPAERETDQQIKQIPSKPGGATAPD